MKNLGPRSDPDLPNSPRIQFNEIPGETCTQGSLRSSVVQGDSQTLKQFSLLKNSDVGVDQLNQNLWG